MEKGFWFELLTSISLGYLDFEAKWFSRTAAVCGKILSFSCDIIADIGSFLSFFSVSSSSLSSKMLWMMDCLLLSLLRFALLDEEPSFVSRLLPFPLSFDGGRLYLPLSPLLSSLPPSLSKKAWSVRPSVLLFKIYYDRWDDEFMPRLRVELFSIFFIRYELKELSPYDINEWFWSAFFWFLRTYSENLCRISWGRTRVKSY